jgi:choloylglycine hydrolase
MRMSRRFWTASVVVMTASTLTNAMSARACTGIRIKTADGTVIYARTMEYGIPLESDIVVIPRGRNYIGTANDKVPGLKWTTKHGVVGANGWGIDHVVDGVNEQGLAGGLFYHPDYAQYPPATKKDAGRALAPWELLTWALTNFATVAEAHAALDAILVCNAAQPKLGFAPPVHAILHDAGGDSLVIEFVGGKVQTYPNPLGVITNAPSFDWHVTNLRNYVNLSPVNVTTAKLDGVDVRELGQGSGLGGLPGDFTPPSRFVRAVVFTNSARQAKTAAEGVNLAHHILSSFDIFPGLVRDSGAGEKFFETTQWATFADMKNKAYYFRSYDNPTIRKVELTKLRFENDKVLVIPMHTDKPTFQDVTSQARILMR